MGSDSVCVAYLHQADVSHSWHVSYTASVMYDMRPGGPRHLLRGGFLAQYGSEASFDYARNKVAKAFLDDRDADWLWWVDSDMGWEHDALERLMAVADPVARPIVGGLCFGTTPVADDGCNGQMFRVFPTAYALQETETHAGFSPIYGYPVNEVIQVGGTGSAFVLIHRSVLEAVRAKHGDTWYDRIPHPKNEVPFGEDLSFCLRAINAGFPIFVHTGVRTNHHKFEYLSEASYFMRLEAPPASEPTAVLVPVLDRPENAEPFMRSLRASTGLANAYAVVGANDLVTRAAWERAGAKVIAQDVDRPGTFACKINDAFARTSEPFVFIVGDDVKFHPGWLDHAQHVARINGASVVGTNDLGNPRVMAGEHGTHLLISRTYVDEVGASWDGPGVVCHEGYRHWFVDDELVTAAKQNGAWAAALGSVVEHMHPLFGKAKNDAVYQLGQSHAEKDRATFARRMKANASRGGC